jgi:hypothetical protein
MIKVGYKVKCDKYLGIEGVLVYGDRAQCMMRIITVMGIFLTSSAASILAELWCPAAMLITAIVVSANLHLETWNPILTGFYITLLHQPSKSRNINSPMQFDG